MNQMTTVIGAGCAVNGNITGDEDLTIQGQVDGSISVSKTVYIDATGVVHADLQVERAVIGGVLVGNVTAGVSVQLLEGGRVLGDIRAPQVSLAEGAAFSGRIDMGEIDLTAERPVSPPVQRAPMGPVGRPPLGGAMPPRLPSLDSPFAGMISPASMPPGSMMPRSPSQEGTFSRPPVTGSLPPRSPSQEGTPRAGAPVGVGTLPPSPAGMSPAPSQVRATGAPVPRMRAIGRLKAKKKG